MKLRFALSGSIVFEGESDCVPPPGSTVGFVMQTYKKGIEAGSLVTATVQGDIIPPHYDFEEGGVVVTLDLDAFIIASDPDPS